MIPKGGIFLYFFGRLFELFFMGYVRFGQNELQESELSTEDFPNFFLIHQIIYQQRNQEE